MSTNETHIISFTGMNDKDLNKDEKFENFKWSPNGKFFGRIKKDILIIYDSPKMQIIPVIINLFYKNYSKLNDI